ncbi:MAG: hypothetical protein UR34_C0008G0009 [candidate division WS6 bacterium GW2011_GWC1_33_20]|nr:MAG: hypothetical protein UR32_C0006G0020 [candidate division WS6 bacterium GW2011_GWE2_33_157]KKP43950.1 MAG: hypothetical protein UR34_C0008G0009 [candidate division WS6 bacterium GW2011_GWC1_33_20]KKP45685.1 MAG: hypothetical protein UR36_C0005G0021 [candidate division WS6 bacterium GW2011_GWF1_33_233]KKP55054.1 MAG: hypothetical protein UR45_C0005G0007 [candidate division WS6 bacterium GW2011_WS6_33_547]OGC36421.1 MAG: hypothetical protein A2369_01395 [candidate division WS6 bacterium RI
MSIIEKIYERITPESEKIVKRFSKQNGLKPMFDLKIPKEQRLKNNEIFFKIYSHYCGESFRSIQNEIIPVDNVYVNQEHHLIACTMETINNKVAIVINTEPENVGIFKCEENIATLKEGTLFQIDGTYFGGYTSVNPETSKETFKYFSFKEIEDIE